MRGTVLADQTIAVVVPALDEAAWIGEVVRTMPAYVDHLILVDDGSRDGTATVARQALVARAPASLYVVRHRRPAGVGAAICSGYQRAVELGADVVAVMAGDGQMDPADLPAVLAPVLSGEADYVKGDRLSHPEVGRVMPPLRLVGSLIFSRLTSLAAGVRISDSQCGYTAVSGAVLRQIELPRIWPRFGYPNDLIGALASEGFRIVDVTVRPVYRGEQSGLRVWHGAIIAWLIARVWARRLARRGSGLRRRRRG